MIARRLPSRARLQQVGRRSLAPYLFGLLLLQVSLLIGMAVSPAFAVWLRPQAASPDHTRARLVTWRRSVYSPHLDPQPGQYAPDTRLLEPTGAPLASSPGKGQTVVLVFVGDGNS